MKKEYAPGISLGPSGPQSGNQGGVNFIACMWKITMKIESEIHNTGFLISPTTHLFPLSGQSGSRGVSSMITLNSKYGIMKNVIKVCYSAWMKLI